MDVELVEIRDFLARHAPFDALPASALDALPARCAITYARRGTTILRAGEVNDRLFLVRSGAVDITDDGQLVDRVGAGGGFGMSALVERGPTRYAVTAREDTLLLTLPQEDFDALAQEHPAMAAHFAATHHGRVKAALRQLQTPSRGSSVLRTSLRDLLRSGPVRVGRDESVSGAARVMTDAGVSSVLVMDGDRLLGIVTDRDLRSRVLAAGTDPSAPVESVMTVDPVTVPVDALAFEAMLEMTGRNIHHLPVMGTDGRVAGLVTTTDLVRLERSNPVYLVADIQRQEDLPGLAEQAGRISHVVEQLVAEDATAADIGRVVAALSDTLTVRLIELAERELGPAPGGYAWVALGSAAREEQALGGDQDHALVLDHDADPADPWWGAMAQRVTDGLVACAIPRCDGDVMATNPRWRLTAGGWRDRFASWAAEPRPDAVLWSAIFYDMRPVCGDASLVRDLRRRVLPEASRSDLLLGHLAAQSARMRPPLGFFRGFVLEDAGEHRDTLDLKRGIGAIVQLARVYALRAGSEALGTGTRLDAAATAGGVARATAVDLTDALELLSYLRLRHQAGQVRQGRAPDNHLDPRSLGSLDRRHLRDAFQIVRSAQQGLVSRSVQVG